MPGSMERSSLHVEGRDDKFSLVNLLIRHGVDYDPKPWPAAFPEFKEMGSVEAVLDGIETAVKLSTGRAIGFVLDADSPLPARWKAVRDRTPVPTPTTQATSSEKEPISHLVRLWAHDAVLAAIETGDARKRDAALKRSIDYQLVTPLSGAVVLENQQQYDEAGLNAPQIVDTVLRALRHNSAGVEEARA